MGWLSAHCGNIAYNINGALYSVCIYQKVIKALEQREIFLDRFLLFFYNEIDLWNTLGLKGAAAHSAPTFRSTVANSSS